MPSWNIHIAQAERLLAREGAGRLGVRDVDAFFFGNLVPDVYVGYMVPDLDTKMRYCDTHLAEPESIPTPRADEFWSTYIHERDLEGEPVDDMVLGAWVHLAADSLWNGRVRAFAARQGLRPGEELRIRKQRDFDTFGRTFDLRTRFAATDRLVRAAARFPQYPIDRTAVERSCDVANGIVERNTLEPGERAVYDLLDERFFKETFEETVATAARRLSSRL